MWSIINKWLDRIESRIAVWQIVRGGGVAGGGVVTGVLSSTVVWIDQFGMFGWWVCFLGGCVLTAAAMALFQLVKVRRIQAVALTKWSEQVDGVNPLDKEFHKQRISVLDLRHPVKHNVENKIFTDCELVAPVNILIRNDCSITGVAFGNVDWVLLRRGFKMSNAVPFDNITIRGGSVLNATIFVQPAIFDMVKVATPSMTFVNQTGDPEIDSR